MLAENCIEIRDFMTVNGEMKTDDEGFTYLSREFADITVRIPKGRTPEEAARIAQVFSGAVVKAVSQATA